MAIKIQTQSTKIPIEVGEITLYFDMSDDNINRFYETKNAIFKELNEMKEDSLEEQKEILKKAVDYILGDGSFDKLYKLSPSIVIMAQYFVSIVEGLAQEINNRTGQNEQELLNKYLNKK